MFDSATAGVAGLQRWFRHLERAKTMKISVPDSSLLLDSLDKSLTTILQGNPSMNFRMHSVRMQLQLDTRPLQDTVEEYARIVLSELELLAVAVPENASKRQKVAALGAETPQKGKGTGKQPGAGKPTDAQGGEGKGSGGVKKPCTGWVTDKGCKFGKSCTFSHAAERSGKCWACGGNHQKADCVAPGGGKYQKQPATGTPVKGKDKSTASDSSGGTGKGKPAHAKASSGAATGLSQEAIKEAAQLLQSLKLASFKPYVKGMTELLCKAQRGEPRGLIDGGATACLRVALDHEEGPPQVVVKLACGETSLYVNPQGTLLSKVYVSPILSVKALLSLGYRIEWDSSKCRIWHAVNGDLDIDVSSGCPEISEGKALELISQYEELVRSRELRSICVHSIMQDLASKSDVELASLITQRDTQADASLQILLNRLFPETNEDLIAQAAVSLQDQEGEPYAWNRRIRQ